MDADIVNIGNVSVWLYLYVLSNTPKQYLRLNSWKVNPLSVSPTKWSNTLKQFVGNLPTNCLSLFDHFVKLALKGLSNTEAELKEKACIRKGKEFLIFLFYNILKEDTW